MPDPFGLRATVLLMPDPFGLRAILATHLSIHDVSPGYAAEVEEALDMCRGVGARPALLVVPDYHRRAPILDDPVFMARLRGLQAEGHEVFLHGLYHQAEDVERPRSNGRLSWFIAQRLVSGGEAEMVGLSHHEAGRRLDVGARILGAAGLRVDGFVAPAWAMPRWLIPMLAARGVRYTEDHLRIYDPARGRARATLLLNWASRSRLRLLSTVAFCRLAERGRSLLPARIAIHPGDLRHPVLRRELERALRLARGDLVEKAADLFV
jgi:predicted deacetylase